MLSYDASRIRRFTAAGFLVLGLLTLSMQRPTAADQTDQETSRLVGRLMPMRHLNRRQLDDKLSAEMFDRFFRELDPQKAYFMQSDIEEFEPHRNQLDDDMKLGRMDFCYTVFDRYQKRVSEQIDRAHYWIDQPHDFTIEESIETDGKKLSWPRTAEEMNERWRQRVKADLLQARLNSELIASRAKEKGSEEEEGSQPLTEAEARERLHKRYNNLRRSIDQYDRGEKLEAYLKAFTSCYDPHSTYMSPISSDDFNIQMRLSLDGIGALLQAEDGFTVVKEVLPGGAAAEDGRLKVGDRIIGVAQEDGEIVDVVETKLQEVVRLIRGPRGTVVRLQVKPKDGTEVKILSMTRKKVELNDQAVKTEIIDTQDRLGRKGRIGVMNVPSFYHDFEGSRAGGNFRNVSDDVAKALEEFERENVDAIIVDLRFNGGGALEDAVKTSGHFIDRGAVVQIKEQDGTIQQLNDTQSGVKTNRPLIVLCNRLSASASEIFAGVIKDYQRGIVVGDMTTHGKGTVQSLTELSSSRRPFAFLSPDPGAVGTLKLTISKFYRVNGDSTQNRGVPSDIVLPSLFDHLELGEEHLENAMPFDQIAKARYSPNRLVSPEVISALQQNSRQRISSQEDFQKVDRSIARYLDRKDRTQVSLNLETRRQEIAEEEEARKEQKLEDEDDPTVRKTNAPVFPDRFYENEVLQITLDYLEALQGTLTVQK